MALIHSQPQGHALAEAGLYRKDPYQVRVALLTEFEELPAVSQREDHLSRFLTIPRGGEKGSAARPANGVMTAGGAPRPAKGVITAGSWEVGTSDTWGGHLLYYRSFFDLFVEHAACASDSIWGKGEGPFSDLVGDLAWLMPNLGPRALEFRKTAAGTGLFGFMICFPDSPDALQAAVKWTFSALVVDDWIERQSAHVACQLANWWKNLAEQSESENPFDAAQAFETLPASLSGDESVRTTVASYLSTLEAIEAHAQKVDPAWFARFAWANHEYIQAVAVEVNTARALRETGRAPRVTEYLAYRCFSSGFIQMPILAALQQGLR